MSTRALFDQVKSATSNSNPCLSIGTLTADVMTQHSAVQTLEEQGIELLHVDVMDGRMWPKITVGHFFVAGLKTKLLKDVHLLIEDPEKQIPAFVNAGADMIAFAVEACADIGAAISILRSAADEAGKETRCGLSIYPETSLETDKPFLDDVDYVTLVSISPDSGKANFLHEMQERVAQLRSWREDLLICIDGAVKKANVGEVAGMGSNVIVTGSAVFDGNDAARNIIEMKQSIVDAG